jgi:hypothetical protein
MHPDYLKLCEFELTQVDKDISALFSDIGPGYHGLPTQIQLIRCLRELVSVLKEKTPNGEKGTGDGSKG